MQKFKARFLMLFSLGILSFHSLPTMANEDGIKLYFTNEDIPKVIENYSRQTGLKFILDSNLKGKISIFMQAAAPQEEAFNQLSKALAMQGIGIVKNETAYVVRTAKQLQRDQIEVSNQKPNPNPERMYSLVYSFKHQSATDIVKNIRTLLSKDGEMVVHKESNKIIFTDWTSNLQRVYDLMEKLDTPSEWSDKKNSN